MEEYEALVKQMRYRHLIRMSWVALCTREVGTHILKQQSLLQVPFNHVHD